MQTAIPTDAISRPSARRYDLDVPSLDAVELARFSTTARVLFCRRTPTEVIGAEAEVAGIDVCFLEGWLAWLPIWRWIKIWPHDRLVPDPTEPEPAVSREIITYRFWAAARRARLLRLTYAHVLHRYGEEKKLFVRGQLVDLDVSTCHIYVYYGEDREIQASFGPAHFGQYDCPHIWIHRRKVIDLFDLLIVRGKRKQLASR